ncbi:MAG: LysR family transcriptional regulator [Myxococcota bacterium]
MDLDWADIRLFLAVAESGSLSAAAKKLTVGQPTVSRRLADLEYRVGARLFQRTPAGVQLSAAGERLVEPARRMAEWAGEVARAAAGTERVPSGVVRIAAAPGIAQEVVAPFAAWLRPRLPKIRIELLCSTHFLDLARGEADLALRTKKPSTPDLTTLATLEHTVGVYAAKSYAKGLKKPIQLGSLDWIAWAPPYQDTPPNPQLEAAIPGFVPAFTSDDYLVQLAALDAGMGAMVLGDVRHRFEPKRGRVRLDIDLGPVGRAALHVVAAKSALDAPRVRAVAEVLVDLIAEVQRTNR